ncbi:MAG: hypothetical protein JO069_08920 [Verrucomicrobia bacterium]|nr:hypothetical protein [Verrucomicrobiota bacterium]
MARAQQAAAAGRLKTYSAGVEIRPFQHCLVCESGEICYPVRDGLPFLLKEEAFYLAQA